MTESKEKKEKWTVSFASRSAPNKSREKRSSPELDQDIDSTDSNE